MTSPVPSTGSAMVSIASGDPNFFRIAAFMVISVVGKDTILAGFPIPGRPGIILGLGSPPNSSAWCRPLHVKEGSHGGSPSQRVRRFPAVAAREAEPQGGRPAE